MPLRPLSSLDRLFLTVRSNDFCYRLTLFTRIMLAAGFIPTGTVDRFRGLLTSRPLEAQLGIPVLRLDRWERIAFGAWALALLTFFASTRSFLPASVGRLAIPLGVVAGVAVLLRFVYIRRRTVDLQAREP